MARDKSKSSGFDNEALRGLTDQQRRLRDAMRLPPDYSQLAGQAHALTDRLKISSPALTELTRQWTDLQAAMTRASAPHVAALEQYNKIVERMRPVLGTFDTAEGLAGILGVSKAMEEASRFHAQMFKLPPMPELGRSRNIFEAFKPDARLARAMLEIADQTAAYRAHFGAELERYTQLSKTLLPLDKLNWLIEEERAADLIDGFGFVPHGEMWAFVADENLTGAEAEGFAEQLAIRVWPQLRLRLAVSLSDCLNDKRLLEMYTQMLAAHEASLFESVRSISAGIIERVTTLARTATGSQLRTYEWLRDEIGSLPMHAIGGLTGYRVWRVVTQHVFSQCRTDDDADSNRFPNRHAASHGWGAETATVIDSLNNILLAHFVITAAASAVAFRRESLDLNG